MFKRFRKSWGLSIFLVLRLTMSAGETPKHRFILMSWRICCRQSWAVMYIYISKHSNPKCGCFLVLVWWACQKWQFNLKLLHFHKIKSYSRVYYWKEWWSKGLLKQMLQDWTRVLYLQYFCGISFFTYVLYALHVLPGFVVTFSLWR